jgi:hypothetical protein
MDSTAQEISDRRLERLEIQAALHGPLTEPSILIEIAELRNRRPSIRPLQRGGFVNELDFDLVRSTVAAALVRLNIIETNQAKDQQSRWLRQLIHDAWMVAITVMVFVNLLLLLK